MVTRICLDSNILIELLNKNEKTKELIKSLEGNFCLSSISAFEIQVGRKSEIITELLDWLYVIPFDNECAKVAADIIKELKNKGELIDIKDLFIAATCIQTNMSLLTYNRKHFDRLEKFGLKLVKNSESHS